MIRTVIEIRLFIAISDCLSLFRDSIAHHAVESSSSESMTGTPSAMGYRRFEFVVQTSQLPSRSRSAWSIGQNDVS